MCWTASRRSDESAGVSDQSVKAAVTAGTLVLPLLAVTQFLMTVDASVMNVSIGTLVVDLDTTVTAVQGVITVYTLVMAAGMIGGGKIGDIIGRRRALRVGLVIYAAGSLITSLAPNIIVLAIGWSVLEGLGAALIMPTITALIAGNFTGQARAAAYGTLAAAVAAAVAAGPIVGGFVTTYFSWRWVFAGEVVIAAGIFALSGVVRDAPAERRPSFDAVGAVLSALGLGCIVFAVLQSSSWGWVEPRVADGSEATPAWLGLSPVTWLLAAGFLLLWCFMAWQRRRVDRSRSPLVDPSLLRNHQLVNGLSVLMLQYLVMMGVFFAMPLFLSIVLGLDAFDTGLRMLPLSLALIVTAPLVPKLLPRTSPRTIVEGGLLVMLLAALLLTIRLDEGADASVTTLPFVLLGVGIGAMSSQLGNVLVSSVPVRYSGEVGGLQYTAQNLGSSLGTALVGAVVMGALTAASLQGIDDAALSAQVKQEASVRLAAGVPFVSNAQLAESMQEAGLSAADQQAVLAVNEDARMVALRRGMAVVCLFILAALLLGVWLPREPLPDTGGARAP